MQPQNSKFLGQHNGKVQAPNGNRLVNDTQLASDYNYVPTKKKLKYLKQNQHLTQKCEQSNSA